MLHLTVNPASEARQSLRQDRARLQAECERLREALGSLERGGGVPAGLEAVCAPSSKEVAGRCPVLPVGGLLSASERPVPAKPHGGRVGAAGEEQVAETLSDPRTN